MLGCLQFDEPTTLFFTGFDTEELPATVNVERDHGETDENQATVVRLDEYEGRSGVMRAEIGQYANTAAVWIDLPELLNVADVWVSAYVYFPGETSEEGRPASKIDYIGLTNITSHHGIWGSTRQKSSVLQSTARVDEEAPDSEEDQLIRGEWLCVELHSHVRDDASGETKLYWDGIQQAMLPEAVSPEGGIRARLGIIGRYKNRNTARVRQIFFDDLWVSTIRAGCPGDDMDGVGSSTTTQ